MRLADFGLATSAMKATKTVAGMVFGKVGYMAPEQATKSPFDGRVDVYGCGVVLWELITGRPLRPADADTKDVARFAAPPPGQFSKRVDNELDSVVSKALATRREDRFATAKDFMRALSRWLARNAPETDQETIAEFMLELFADARTRDHAAYNRLLESLPHTGVWERAPDENPSDRQTRDVAEHATQGREELAAGRWSRTATA